MPLPPLPRRVVTSIARAVAVCAALLVAGPAAGPAGAADDAPAAAPAAAASPLAGARAHIAAGRWQAAIDELRRIDAAGSADWHNLMGYALRKAPQPDLAAAERHYDEALRIDPRHRGALEYSGELYLHKGDLPRAEQRLAALDKACRFGCEEYTDLKKAIAEYKDKGKARR